MRLTAPILYIGAGAAGDGEELVGLIDEHGTTCKVSRSVTFKVCYLTVLYVPCSYLSRRAANDGEELVGLID